MKYFDLCLLLGSAKAQYNYGYGNYGNYGYNWGNNYNPN